MFCFFFLTSTFSKRYYDNNGFPLLPDCETNYYENFSDESVNKRWFFTTAENYGTKWRHDLTRAKQTRANEKCMVVADKNKTHIISTKFDDFIVTDKTETLIIQYETRNMFIYSCATVLMSVMIDDFNSKELTNKSKRYLDFGPSFCSFKGSIVLNLYTESGDNVISHKLKKTIPIPVDEIQHLYTLILKPNNNFELMIDSRSMYNGSFANSFTPPIVEPEFIDDINDRKPSNWDDREMIEDLNARKPEYWDKIPEMIPDPARSKMPKGWLINEQPKIPDPFDEKPDDWNTEIHGEWKPNLVPNPKCKRAPGCGPWKPPMIRNPKYKGEWKRPLIKNPAYKGEWEPRQVKNPNFIKKEVVDLPKIKGISFTIWSEYHDVMFTNVLIGKDEYKIKRWNMEDFASRQLDQIRSMRPDYDWINVDDEIEIPPEPGMINYIVYVLGYYYRYFKRSDYKLSIVVIISSVVLILLPLVLLVKELFLGDPFNVKQD